jgi:cilia- and flagella-associated protein 251
VHWAFGFSKDYHASALSLCTKDRNALFLLSAHSAVIYDFEHRKQTVLQGHCNIISCCAIDKTKRWIVTADSGPESIMVIWDSWTQLPVKTYLLPHPNGTSALEFSEDGSYIATLSSKANIYGEEQELAIWAWTTPEDEAVQRTIIPGSAHETFHSVKFNPNSHLHLTTTSANTVYFWNWESFVLESYNGKIAKADLGQVSGDYVATIFLPNSETALTATSHGYVIVWENRNQRTKDNTQKKAPLKTAVKAVRLLECSINIISVSPNNYLVLGCGDGAIRFYDFYLRLEAWFEDLNAGPVLSVSFAMQSCPYAPNEAGQPGLKFWAPDFIVGTKDSFVVGVESRLFDEVRKEDRRGTLLMQGLSGSVVALACHPMQPLVAFLCKNGILQLWNYEMKLLLNIREFSHMKSHNEVDKSSTAAGNRSSVFARDVAFHNDGNCLAVSFSNGTIKILSTQNLVDLQTFSPSLEGIHLLTFSSSGNFLAACDDSHHVMLFKRYSIHLYQYLFLLVPV